MDCLSLIFVSRNIPDRFKEKSYFVGDGEKLNEIFGLARKS